ncbi:hypothetical protein JB92DRAFT_2737762, partial [Gautieria morchelliformis]
WPIYVFPRNMAKWFRCKPNSNSCEHWAYIPSLPDAIKDFIQQICGGKAGSGPLLTHCRREFIQAVWALLLDDDFIEAYKHGIVVMCADGIQRRIYLRLMTYSVDYPEKMLMLSLRDKGTCPCPCCLVRKKEICDLGKKRDRVRQETQARADTHLLRGDIILACQLIYDKTGYGVSSKAVEDLLKEQSQVPTENALSSRMITTPSFNKYQLFPVDIMHEVELGVWKAVFTHLIWLLNALSPDKVHELNKRCVPQWIYHASYLSHPIVSVRCQPLDAIPSAASLTMCLK